MRALSLVAVLMFSSLSASASSPEDEAWELYADAVDARSAGNQAKADALLEKLRREHPQHPAAKRALRAPAPSPERTTPRELGRVLRNESQTTLARAELAILQTINGLTLGIEACRIIRCEGARPNVITPMLGAGVGLAGALYLSREGITPGHALSVNSGALWGAFNLGMLSLALDTETETSFSMLLGGQLGGTLLGHFAWSTLRPSAGDVSLMNSGGLWASVLNLLILNTMQISGSEGSYLLASNLGLLSAGILSRHMPMSRSRTLIIDAGGILGLLFGMGVAVLVDGDQPIERVVTGVGAVGAVGGLVGAAILSKNWDLDVLPPAQFSLVPTEKGAMLLAGMAW